MRQLRGAAVALRREGLRRDERFPKKVQKLLTKKYLRKSIILVFFNRLDMALGYVLI